jgi:hypothetical protein
MVVGIVWGDREFHAHSEYVFSFEISYLCIENKFEKRTMCKNFQNMTMRVPLMFLNLLFKEK